MTMCCAQQRSCFVGVGIYRMQGTKGVRVPLATCRLFLIIQFKRANQGYRRKWWKTFQCSARTAATENTARLLTWNREYNRWRHIHQYTLDYSFPSPPFWLSVMEHIRTPKVPTLVISVPTAKLSSFCRFSLRGCCAHSFTIFFDDTLGSSFYQSLQLLSHSSVDQYLRGIQNWRLSLMGQPAGDSEMTSY